LGARLRPRGEDYLLTRTSCAQLAQTMPRLRLSPGQAPTLPLPDKHGGARDGARGSHARAGADRSRQGADDGARLRRLPSAERRGFDAPPKNEPVVRTLGLAPDLRLRRERQNRLDCALAARSRRGEARRRHAKLDLGLEDARDLAAFLSFGELEPLAPKPAFERLPVLSRRVGFDEVNEQVFAVTCRHCHTNPDLADGDGGPGTRAALAFKPRKIIFRATKASSRWRPRTSAATSPAGPQLVAQQTDALTLPVDGHPTGCLGSSKNRSCAA